jgi:hypothetical protein
MARTGRPPKPEGEKYIQKMLRFPPHLWAELEALIPEGQRAGVVHEGLKREPKRRRRAMEREATKVEKAA